MKWADDETGFLIINYRKMSIEELIDNLNRSKNSIRYKAFTLNLTKKQKHFSWTEEGIGFLIENYGNLKIKEIEKILNHTAGSIQSKASELNLTRKRLAINEDFLKEWTPEMVWIFGFWIADGHMLEKNNCISFSSNDFELLEIIKFNLKSGHKISKDGEKGFKLSIYNKTLYDDLLKLGGTPRKSLTIQFPKVPDEFLPDFIRGYLDGDGSNYIHKSGNNRYLGTSFVGNVDFLTILKDKIEEHANINTTVFNKNDKNCNPRIYKLQYNGKKAIALCDYIYQDSENLRLERKYEKYDQMKKEYLKKLVLKNVNS